MSDQWYLIIPEGWSGPDHHLPKRQQRHTCGHLLPLERAEEGSHPFLAIYKLTGINSSSQAAKEGRFILAEDGDAIYAAEFFESGWNCGLDEAGVAGHLPPDPEQLGRRLTGAIHRRNGHEKDPGVGGRREYPQLCGHQPEAGRIRGHWRPGTGEEALAQLKQNPGIKVALLDIMLPDIDGFEVCRRIRARDNKIGIIMLTARTQEMDKVTGLMTGADDYVTKPLLPGGAYRPYRRPFTAVPAGRSEADTGEFSQPPFLLNTRNRTLEKNGQRVKLTQVEYSIIKLFMDNPGKALSREEILDSVWGRDYFGELKIVDVNIRRLRIKDRTTPRTRFILPPCGDMGISGGG